MAVPTGESVGDLHCTLVFLGDDVADQDAPDPLLQSLAHLADSFTVIDAQVTGRAIFEEGAVVYLIGDNPQLPDLHTDALNAAYTITTVPRQHEPWTPRHRRLRHRPAPARLPGHRALRPPRGGPGQQDPLLPAAGGDRR